MIMWHYQCGNKQSMIWLPLGQMSLGRLRRPGEWFTSNQFVSLSMILILIFQPKDNRTKCSTKLEFPIQLSWSSMFFYINGINLKTIIIWIIIVAAMKKNKQKKSPRCKPCDPTHVISCVANIYPSNIKGHCGCRHCAIHVPSQLR